MTKLTKRDAINGAMSLADDVAQGRVDPAALEAQAVADVRALFGTVVGPDDLAWPVQVEVARQVLGLGGIPADELAEWLAVVSHRAGEPVSASEPDQAPPEVETLPSVALSPESAEREPDPEDQADPEPVTPPTPQPKTNRYDPLRGWSPGSIRR
ncbi:hypothetical protein [Mycobacterium persicum]|uniref:hypothetical protein n=1 Tax=Mycobacterium persicum TaxID=1487726 RepID=UPI0009F5F83B|nr:hypothetical protein [Mycobacterium persicum]ORB40945.1 hypothetical protein BST40_21795 [Mycobacterium persicum]